jgi:hypothetical protein
MSFSCVSLRLIAVGRVGYPDTWPFGTDAEFPRNGATFQEGRRRALPTPAGAGGLEQVAV